MTCAEGFAVYRPKFIYETDEDMDDSLSQALGQAFMVGTEAYEEGSALWERHKDESL